MSTITNENNNIPPPYYNSDPNSFASVSVDQRWPEIITQALDDVHRTVMEVDHEHGHEKIQEGKQIISSLTALKHELQHNHVLTDLVAPEKLPEEYSEYNKAIKQLSDKTNTWHTAPWLFSECYLYQRIHSVFRFTKHWSGYDVFLRKKTDTFLKSEIGVTEIAVQYSALEEKLKDANLEALAVLFREFIDISLWGNATDLSLLTSVSLEDIQSLQGAEARKKNEKNILVNDLDTIWKVVSENPGGRIDIVLDNSGFELYTDLVLVLFLLDSKLADQVVLHPKDIPWFVSDVTPKDFDYIVAQLQQPGFFSNSKRKELNHVASKILDYHENGQLTMKQSRFWTSYDAYWEINSNGINGGSQVHKSLLGSKLVIYKGDLNHRKILGDVQWPRDTPFTTAIQQMSKAKIPFVTLRTIKADVVSGLKANEESELEKEWIETGHKIKYEWAWSGKYALVQFNNGE